MADWRDRLAESVQLTSPDGNVFTALWQRNTYSASKKLGIFEYPKVDGSVVQDLNLNGTRYPLTIFFEGANHDIEARNFFIALKEIGVWEVIHPIHGLLILQPITFTPTDDPTGNGNITQVQTEWIEPSTDAVLQSVPQLAAVIASQSLNVNESASDQLTANIQTATAAEGIATEAATEAVVISVRSALGPIFEGVAEITTQIEAIERGIQATLDDAILSPIALAGQIQALIQLPLLAISDIGARLDAYRNLITGLGNLSPEAPNTEGRNAVAIQELAFSAAITAVAGVASTGILDTRAEAIEAADDIFELFRQVVDELDTTQEIFGENTIDSQYFSLSQAFTDLSLLVAQAIQFFLVASYDLKVEKRFTLSVPSAPIMITIEEYGELGENDSNYELFLASNMLKGNDIRILPAGREVVVYV